MERVRGLIPGQESKIPYTSIPKSQNITWKQYCNKFSRDFKHGPHQKKKSLKTEGLIKRWQKKSEVLPVSPLWFAGSYSGP